MVAPRLYDEFASWWSLLSAPAEYAEEAALFERLVVGAASRPVETLLELGSGGGNTASFLKARFQMTLVDCAPRMLEVSRALNPECVHVEGDMRTVRLGRRFDAVFVHDAVCYMTSEDDLRSAIESAWVHCEPGGVALFAPDYVLETFVPGTDAGGHDGPDRSLRYLEWMWDPDPTDSTYLVDMAYLLREADGSVRVEHDRHVEGIFARATWLSLFAAVGFEVDIVPFEHSELEPGAHELFMAHRPLAGQAT